MPATLPPGASAVEEAADAAPETTSAPPAERDAAAPSATEHGAPSENASDAGLPLSSVPGESAPTAPGPLAPGQPPSGTGTPPATRRGAPAASSAGPSADMQPRPHAGPLGAQITPLTGDDCGQCTACQDKPKFGGPGIKRKGCLAKRTTSVLRPPVAGVESAVRAPALDTPSSGGLDTPEGGIQHSSLGASSSSAAAGSASSSFASAALSHLPGGRGGGGLRESLLRKEYSLRKRSAAAGEQILEADAEAEAEDGQQLEHAALPAEMGALPEDEEAPVEEAPVAAPVEEAPPAEAGPSEMEEEAPVEVKGEEAAASSSEPTPADPEGSGDKDVQFSDVRLVGSACFDNLDEEDGDSPRQPLKEVNELLIYRNGVPCTPQLKTPEIEALASGGALGMSPLSEFASLLDMTPRLPEQVCAPRFPPSLARGRAFARGWAAHGPR